MGLEIPIWAVLQIWELVRAEAAHSLQNFTTVVNLSLSILFKQIKPHAVCLEPVDKLRLTFFKLLTQFVGGITGSSPASHLSNKIIMHMMKLLTILSFLESKSNEHCILVFQNWAVQGSSPKP